MVTELMWKSLDIVSNAFAFLGPSPLRWNKAQRHLVYTAYSWKLVPWTAALISGLVVLQLPCVILISRILFGIVVVPLNITVIVVIFSLLMGFGFFVELGVLLFAKNFVTGFNFLVEMEKEMKRKLKNQPRKKAWTKSKRMEIEIDWVGWVLVGIAIIFSVYPYFITVFGMLLNIDPWNLLLKYGFGIRLSHLFHPVTVFIIWIVRGVLVIPGVFMTCKDFAFTVNEGKIAMDLVSSTINHLGDWGKEIAYGRLHVDVMFRRHLEQEIILLLFYDIFSSFASILMSVGFMLNISFNYVTLKLHHVVPMPMFLYFPTVSCLIPVLIDILLPMMINVYENSKRVHESWAWHSSRSGDLKYLRRRLRGTRIHRMYTGIAGYNFFFFKKSTKVTFYAAIVDYTISALLSD